MTYIFEQRQSPRTPTSADMRSTITGNHRGVAVGGGVSGTLVRGRYLTDFYYLCTANETTEEAGSFLRSLYSIAIEQTKVKEEDCQ